MSPKRKRVSAFRLRVRLRLQTYWASFRLTRAARKYQKELKRTELLQLALSSSLLRQKELEQLQEMHQHRLQEMQEATAQQKTPLVMQAEVTSLEELKQLLSN
jgi:hypothetical protein